MRWGWGADAANSARLRRLWSRRRTSRGSWADRRRGSRRLELGLDAQRPQRLPDAAEGVDQGSPLLGDGAAVGGGQRLERRSAVGRQPQLGAVGEPVDGRLSGFERVPHPGQLRLERTSALAEQVSPRSREAEDGRRAIDQDPGPELRRRPHPAQRGGAFEELDRMTVLGQSGGGGQAGEASTDHHHRGGHQAAIGRSVTRAERRGSMAGRVVTIRSVVSGEA